ncbi:MAG: hypothetical protein QW292_09465 [Candidatus Parvarchaeota archaeon]
MAKIGQGRKIKCSCIKMTDSRDESDCELDHTSIKWVLKTFFYRGILVNEDQYFIYIDKEFQQKRIGKKYIVKITLQMVGKMTDIEKVINDLCKNKEFKYLFNGI